MLQHQSRARAGHALCATSILSFPKTYELDSQRGLWSTVTKQYVQAQQQKSCIMNLDELDWEDLINT